MSRTIRNNHIDNKDAAKSRRGRQGKNGDITVRVQRRRDPDLRRMGRALITFAMQEAQAESGTDKPAMSKVSADD